MPYLAPDLTPILAVVNLFPILFVVAIDKIFNKIRSHTKVSHLFKSATVLSKVVI